MKKLSDLYEGFPDININDIKINSKEVEKNDLFICINGITKNRNDYVEEAIENGACAVVSNKKMNINVPLILVDDPNKELYRLAPLFYDFDRSKLKLIATTGTNGKTTVASVIKDLIKDSCGYIGTNGLKYKNHSEKIKNTTPDADRLYKYFKILKDNGCNIISMEASSEAFLRKRLSNLKFDVGIVTNVTRDHLNVHKTFDNYLECKKELVRNVKDNGYSILNVDDLYFEDFYKIAKGTILTYGKKESTLQIIDFKEEINKTIIKLKYNNKLYNIISPLLGEHNIYNLCAAILALISQGYSMPDIIKRIKNIKIPEGRCEFLDFKQNYYIMLDYAHTPDALSKIFNYINKVKKKKVITVIGSAGGRDTEKRPEMGKIVLNNSNYVIFTMDDHRFEDVNKIIDDLIGNSKNNNYERIIDRKDAINKALNLAKKDDIILILGKGTDNYMAIEDKYFPYSDLEVIKEYFKNKIY